MKELPDDGSLRPGAYKTLEGSYLAIPGQEVKKAADE
jgi:hypothetical protein